MTLALGCTAHLARLTWSCQYCRMSIRESVPVARLVGVLVLAFAVAFLVGMPFLVVLTGLAKTLYFVAGVALLAFGGLLLTSPRRAAPGAAAAPVRAAEEYVVLPR